MRYATKKTSSAGPSIPRGVPSSSGRPPRRLRGSTRALKRKGYGLLLFDGYRPWAVTKQFWDVTPADKKVFVANPTNGSRHNRGGSVDLTLLDLETGRGSGHGRAATTR